VYPGRFIVLEGIDASGTTTQCRALAAALEQRGHRTLRTFEPSNGDIGLQIRSWLGATAKGPGPQALALLFAADRLEHLRKEIIPALEEGYVVVCDRYLWSSFAYQGLDCDLNWVRSLNSRALRPDLALWLEIPVEIALQRCAARLAKGEAKAERFDGAPLQHRLHQAYASFSADPAEALSSVDATLTVEDVTRSLLAHCEAVGL
jgi:dTMP kinase